MSKTKKLNSSHYEVLFIIPNKFTEEEAKKIISKVEDTIIKHDGKITYQEYWGKKKLAYEIKHNVYGYYALFEFDTPKEKVAQINQSLRLNTDVLRHQIVIKRVKSKEEIAKSQAIAEKIEAKKEKEKQEEKEEAEKIKQEIREKKTEKRTEGKKDLKDLDEKLEGILNAKDLI